MSRIAGMMRQIERCNKWEPSRFTNLWVGGEWVGNLKPVMVDALRSISSQFVILHGRMILDDEGLRRDERTAIIDDCVEQLIDMGIIKGLQGERYPLAGVDRNSPVATIDRAVAPYIGARAYGQHINGYINDPKKGLMLWIGRRAQDRHHFPGKLDNMVAGGLPVDLSLNENLIKECQEEASIPPELARQARPVGTVSYCVESNKGLKPDTLYCYDLEVPADFVPVCSDGEVESFQLLTVDEVIQLVSETDEFKLNCNLVIADFLVRHGCLAPEEEGYCRLVTALHAALPGDIQ